MQPMQIKLAFKELEKGRLEDMAESNQFCINFFLTLVGEGEEGREKER